jgi:hypothetical protein
MTPEHVKALLPVLQAFADGQPVQAKAITEVYKSEWKDVSDPHWAVEYYEYRIKPETVKYRRYLYRHHRAGVECHAAVDVVRGDHVKGTDGVVEKSSSFIRWIDTEWQEVEV